MDWLLFLKAILIGFSISIPVGPVGILCITHSLNRGKLSGFISGFGSTVADISVAVIVGTGATLITSFFIKHEFWIGFLGGLILLLVAIHIILKKSTDNHAEIITPPSSTGFVGDFFLSFFLTITNPLNIIFSSAIFAKLFSLAIEQQTGNTIVVIGILCGSAGWWLLLSNMAGSFQKKLTVQKLAMINKIAGYVFLILAIWFVVQSFI